MKQLKIVKKNPPSSNIRGYMIKNFDEHCNHWK